MTQTTLMGQLPRGVTMGLFLTDIWPLLTDEERADVEAAVYQGAKERSIDPVVYALIDIRAKEDPEGAEEARAHWQRIQRERIEDEGRWQ